MFLGNRQYFVSSDVGGGRMQWYAFHCEAAGGTDPEGSESTSEVEGRHNGHAVDSDMGVHGDGLVWQPPRV